MLALLCVIPGPFKHNPLTTGLPSDRLNGFGQALREAPMGKKGGDERHSRTSAIRNIWTENKPRTSLMDVTESSMSSVMEMSIQLLC